MIFEPSDRLPFFDVNGNLRHACALSLFDRSHFLKLREICRELADKSADFRLLYDTDRRFQQTIDAMLLMSGVSPAWVDAQLACRLILGYGDEPPLLMALNFPSIAPLGDEGDAFTLPDGYSPEGYALASLWASMGDLERAIDVARKEPWTIVQEVLRCRAHQLKVNDPEYQKKSAAQECAETFKEAARSGVLDQLLSQLDD